MTNLLRSLQVLAMLVIYSANAQEIFNYEKEITDKENYFFLEIEFKALEKKDSITLSGTLIYPKTPFNKIVVIVPGSGADTRNSHYLLTQKLLENNIAVYRYDERGLGKSGGKFNTANYTISMMSAELTSAIKALRKNHVLTGKKLGLLGHSQGGMVTMDAFEKNVPVDFLIQWATPVQKHGEFLKYQLRKGQNTFGEVLKYDTAEEKLAVMSELHKVVAENKQLEDWPLTKKLDKIGKKLGYTKSRYGRFPYLTLASEKDIVRKDFEPAYKGISVPMLYIVGSLDTFVDPMAETKLLESFRNPNITVMRMEGLHHYLGRGKLTLETLYDIDDAALLEITNWIKAR
jgi:pimeloyl-ACP methyl ester carboxylesterase